MCSSSSRPSGRVTRDREWRAQKTGAEMNWAIAKGYRPDDPVGGRNSDALPHKGNTTRHCKALLHGEVSAALVKVPNSQAYADGKLTVLVPRLVARRRV